MNTRVNIVLACIISYCVAEDLNTLQQLHILFRHGDRNPEQIALYPKDPHINDTWAPYGFGQLTLTGKMREYNLGKAFRKRYDKYLGKSYVPELLDAVSTQIDRTQMSLQLVLAGLFPPTPTEMWNSALRWQPIPYKYVSTNDMSCLTIPIKFCQKFIDLFNEAQQTEYFLNFFKTNADLIEYINENSGLNVTSSEHLFLLHNSLSTEVQTGREIPEWTKKIYPDFVYEGAYLYYQAQTNNDELNKLAGGNFLKKIIGDISAKKEGTLKPEGRKLFLYSGHEYNIAYALGALGIFKPHIPPYASYLAFELHNINNVYGIKILYQNYSGLEPQYMVIPGCEEFCPLDEFIALIDHVIPDENTRC